MKNLPPAAWYVLGGLIAAAGLYLVLKKTGGAVATAATDAARAVGNAVNPVSDTNLVYRGVNAALGSVTNDPENFSLGVWLYDATHGTPEFKPKP